MRILVFSDSHGKISPAASVIERIPSVDCIFHLGDHAADADKLAEMFPKIQMYSVSGNCDFAPHKNTDIFVNLEGINFFLTHGHKYNVKSSLLSISLKAKSHNADFAVFGHTHCPLNERDGSLTLLNPGSCKNAALSTYAVIEIENNKARASILDI